jgi:hypothetical protein
MRAAFTFTPPWASMWTPSVSSHGTPGRNSSIVKTEPAVSSKLAVASAKTTFYSSA